MRIPKREIKILIRVALVSERLCRQAQHSPRMTCSKWDFEAVRARVLKSMDAVGPEVVVLPLLAVGDDGRAGGFEALDGVFDRGLVLRMEIGIGDVPPGDGLDEVRGTGDAADLFGGDCGHGVLAGPRGEDEGEKGKMQTMPWPLFVQNQLCGDH